jgi:hypothetical protein
MAVKIVHNSCSGMFEINLGVARRMAELGHGVALAAIESHDAACEDRGGVIWSGVPGIARDDKALVQAVEELGSKADTLSSQLRTVAIIGPGADEDVEYDIIEESNGLETVLVKVGQDWCRA